MSVHNPNNNNTGAIGGAMADAVNRAGMGGTGPVPPEAQAAGQQRGSIFNINSRLFRPLPKNSTAEMVQNMIKALQKSAESAWEGNFGDYFKLIVLDSASDQVALSSILVCYNQNYQGTTHVGVFSLIVEGSGQNTLRTNRFVPIAGKNVEIEIAPGDVFNPTMWERAQAKVQTVYGKGVTIHNAGAAVLPTELKSEDSAHVYRVFSNAAAALFTILDVELGGVQVPFSVSEIEKDVNKTANLDYNPLPIDNAVGLPVRSDLAITMRAFKGEQANDLHESSIDLTRIDGFVDLVFAKPDMINNGFGQVATTQSYYPRFVITRAVTDIDALTPELHLLAISTSSMLWTQHSWMSAYLPRFGDEQELRDLGAVGYEINLTGDPNQRPERINTRDESFTTASLLQLIQTTIRDKLIISMDIEERGEQSWLARNYIAAANGDADAIAAIVQAADNLTSNHFSRLVAQNPQNGPMVIARDDKNRIHLGTWKNKKGDLRDIRDFDYLAVLNRLAAVDPQAAIDWSATFDNLDIPLEMRLEKRAHILRSLSGESFRLKGWARRITFTFDFIATLNAACQAAGLTVRPANINVDLAGTAGRAAYDTSNVAFAGNPMNGMFSYDSGNFNAGKNYNGIGNSFMASWGHRPR